MNEKQITEIIKEWSKSHKEITLIRFNTTGIPDGKGGFRKNSLAGAPDFIGIYMMADMPVSFFFEIKSPKGKQSDSQKKFEEASKKLGHHYYIIRSAQEAEDAIAEIHNKHRRKISWSFLGLKDAFSAKWLDRRLRRSSDESATLSKALSDDPAEKTTASKV